MARAATLALLIGMLVSSSVAAQTWIDGEMGYRITVVPEASPGARHGLRPGDILAEPQPLPRRLVESGPEGVEILLYRLDKAKPSYDKGRIRITFLAGEEKRLGLTGDLGFLVTAVRPGSLGARAELKPGDFIPKINETFVHGADDLKLVEDAYEKGEQVLISFIRWSVEADDFKNGVSRRRFVK